MSQSFLYTWLEWVYSNRLIPSAPPCSVFNDSLVPLNKVHTYDCRLRSSTVWLRPSLLHLYLMLPVYGPHVQKEETFTSHIVFPCLLWLLSHISRPRMCCVCSGGATLWDPMDCSPPDSSVHGIFQARILYFLLQKIFWTQGSIAYLLSCLHWQAGSFPLRHLGSFY